MKDTEAIRIYKTKQDLEQLREKLHAEQRKDGSTKVNGNYVTRELTRAIDRLADILPVESFIRALLIGEC